MRVLIVHPDLGVGGAERLILDIASAAKSKKHDVTILTNQYDPKHCFEDSKEFNIITKFSSIPRHFLGKFHAFFAYLKMMLASLWLIYFSGLKFDVIIVDQISLPVAVFKFNYYKVLFYCHFPDQLLCVYDKNRNFLKRLYRLPLDWIETVTTGLADEILVNSKFTTKIFRDTFTSLEHKEVNVLYPSLNTEKFDNFLNNNLKSEESTNLSDIQKQNLVELEKSKKKKFVFLSINRYERKKDLKLALNALYYLRVKLTHEQWDQCHLIMAGGYDYRVDENVSHYNELKELVDTLQLNEKVSFLRSISDQQKVTLLRQAFCLLYTPTNEHFGIVPLEAMYCEKPVIATNTGGPLETVATDVTGYLALPEADKFAEVMDKLIKNPDKHRKFSISAKQRVVENFSFLAFKKNLNDILNRMVDPSVKKKPE